MSRSEGRTHRPADSYTNILMISPAQSDTGETAKRNGTPTHSKARAYTRKIARDHLSPQMRFNPGIPRITAMAACGHKTDSMFRRQTIVARYDLRMALRRTPDYLKKTAAKRPFNKMETEQVQKPSYSSTIQERRAARFECSADPTACMLPSLGSGSRGGRGVRPTQTFTQTRASRFRDSNPDGEAGPTSRRRST